MTNVLFEMTNQICLGRLKKSNLICKNQIYFEKLKKWDLLKEDSYSQDKLIMHASHIKKKDFNLTLNSFFEISKSTIL